MDVLEGMKGVLDDALGHRQREAEIGLCHLEVKDGWAGRVLDGVEVAVGEEDATNAVALLGTGESTVLGRDNVPDVVEVCCRGAGLGADLEGSGGGEDAVKGLEGDETASGGAAKMNDSQFRRAG